MQQKYVALVAAAMLVAGAAAARHSAASLRRGRAGTSESLQRGQGERSLGQQHAAALAPDFWTIVNNGMPLMPTPDPFPAEFNLMPQRCPTGQLRVGCVFDSQVSQQRWYQDFVPKEDRVPMTPDVCYAFCRNSSGAQYFGLAGGDKCYCTPFFHDTGKGGTGDCDMPCVGDATRMCGGMEMVDIYSMHDCNNIGELNCPFPPAPLHAKTFTTEKGGSVPCANHVKTTLTTKEAFCEIQCQRGYELIRNDLKCVRKGNILKAWGEVEGNATCDPVTCGLAPHIPNSTYPPGEVVFPNNVTYQCNSGFSADALPTGPKNFTYICDADGFVGQEKCLRVECGPCPVQPHASAAEQGVRVFEDKCNYQCATGYTLTQNASGPTTYSTTCEADANFSSGPTCGPVLCGLPPAMNYSSIQGSGPNVSVEYQSAAEYQCDTGYTITGQAAGNTSYERKCQADGLFAPSQGCKPVECGKPPDAQNAIYDKQNTMYYNETAVYICAPGHTLDGKASGPQGAALTCGADGLFKGSVPNCQPVECGVPPPEPKAKVLGSAAQQVAVYPTSVKYTCDDGHTLTGVVGDRGDFSVQCQANGNFTPAKQCTPVNCGTPPSVSNCAYAKANVTFPDQVKYTCKEGFSLDAAPNGSKQFNVSCLADGFSQPKQCSPIRCGSCPQGSGPYEFAVPSQSGVRVYQDQCSYACKTGYSLDQNATGPTSFNTSCLANGSFSTPGVCVPVSCGAADSFKYTRLVGAAGTSYPEVTKYECVTGYTLSGQAGGPTQFDRQCRADGTYSPAQFCQPVSCGRPVAVPKSTYDSRSHVYGQNVTYTCDVGHTLDGTAAGANSSTMACGANGTFEGSLPQCLPVSCGEPTQPPFTDIKGHTAGTPVVYPTAVQHECVTGYTTNGQIGGPGRYSRSCQADGTFTPNEDCKPVNCGQPTAVADSTYPTQNVTYGQDVPYACDSGFSVSATAGGPKRFNVTCEEQGYEAAKSCDRVRCGPCPQHKHAVVQQSGERVFEDQCSYRCDPGYTETMGSFNTSCKASGNFSQAGACLPVYCGKPSVPSHTNLTSNATHYPQAADFKCHRGYTLTGVAGGPTSYQRRCQANASWTAAQQCKPVTCGQPATVADASYRPHSRVYKEKVTYNCSVGYTLDGLANGSTQATTTCGADGSFKEPAPTCNPVVCGVPPSEPNADVLGASDSGQAAVYSDKVPYECHMGYTLTGVRGGPFQFERECQANGTFSPTQVCKPVLCGAPPPVANSKYPSGNVTYPSSVTYTCDKGHTVNADPSGAADFNITCEPGGFTPVQSCLAVQCGKCPDESSRNATSLTQGARTYEDKCRYKCQKGYTLNSDAAGPAAFNTTCLETGNFSQSSLCKPVVCGPPPSGNGSTLLGSGANQDLVYPQVAKYACLPGHTLTGQAGGATQYEQKCEDSGSFSPGQQCKPVQCGAPPTVQRAAYNRKSLVYNESVRYMCAPGHTLNGSAAAPDKAVLTCTANGTYQGPQVQCVPVLCGSAPAEPNAKLVGAAASGPVSFPSHAKYECLAGHTLDAQIGGPNTFERRCQGDGQFAAGQTCKPVVCGQPPSVPHSTYPTQDVTYPDNVTYTCDTGYSMDTLATGPKSFKVSCKAGGFDTPQSCSKIICGVCPNGPALIPHATPAAVEVLKSYEDACNYTCEAGYTLNQDPSGPKTFSTECLANGSFSSARVCAPVLCGAPPKVGNASLLNSSAASAIKYKDVAQYECDQGYTLTGFAGAPNKFDVTCTVDGTYSAPKQCKPVSCGEPSQFQKAMHVAGPRVYGEIVTYTCESGYTLSGVPLTANQTDMTCGADGNYKGTQPSCQPVQCGVPPPQPNANLTSSAAAVSYPSSVEFECGQGYTITGVAGGSRRFTQDCQADGSFSPAQRCLPVLCGATPQVANSTSNRASVGGNMTYSEQVTYKCDTGFSITGTAQGAKEFTVTCEPGGGLTKVESCKLIRCGNCPSVSKALSVSMTAGVSHYGDVCAYMCEKGYTLDGHASGEPALSTTCLANGTFSQAATCLPVSCGTPQAISHATVQISAQSAVSYPQTVTYKCDPGYTVTGQKGGATQFDVRCMAVGNFSQAQQCKRVPVECGTAPQVPHAVLLRVKDGRMITDVSPPQQYQCQGGYSTKKTDNPWAPTDVAFNLTCRSDGSFSPAPTCMNIADCPHHSCGQGGRCEEVQNPSGQPEHDYRCVCHSGFEVTKVNSSTHPGEKEQVCSNINDCPAIDACGGRNGTGQPRGQCTDGNASYSCACHAGYQKKPVQGLPQNETCTPVKCGLVPNINNATHTPLHNVEATYDTLGWIYTCDTGFTTTGNVGDSSSFPMKCESSGSFTQAQQCLPISCGAPPSVPFSSMSPQVSDLKYPQTITYTCDMGYSTGGTFTSPIDFTVSCLANGTITPNKTCILEADGWGANSSDWVLHQAESEKMQGSLRATGHQGSRKKRHH